MIVLKTDSTIEAAWRSLRTVSLLSALILSNEINQAKGPFLRKVLPCPTLQNGPTWYLPYLNIPHIALHLPSQSCPLLLPGTQRGIISRLFVLVSFKAKHLPSSHYEINKYLWNKFL